MEGIARVKKMKCKFEGISMPEMHTLILFTY